jgi:hypothetical protein
MSDGNELSILFFLCGKVFTYLNFSRATLPDKIFLVGRVFFFFSLQHFEFVIPFYPGWPGEIR